MSVERRIGGELGVGEASSSAPESGDSPGELAIALERVHYFSR